MQDRYAGDIGDFGKIGLLKCLQAHGFTIGVNWYRVAALNAERKKDGSFKQDDGKYLIPDTISDCDSPLAKKLTEIAKGERSVTAIQDAGLLPGAIYYDEYLTVSRRTEWHENAKRLFKDVNLVFMDPDNGLLVDSVGKQSTRSVKYVFYEEVKDYIDSGKSVLVYNHRCRKPERKYFEDIELKLEERLKVCHHVVQEITFRKGTIRDYFAIPACKEHLEMFCDAFADMKKSKWGQCGVCRLFPEWADSIPKRYQSYEEYIFLEVESKSFMEHCSFEDYKRDVVRYLMLCSYNYQKEDALSLVDQYIDDIKESYAKKEPVEDLAIDIGYACG